MHYMSKEERYAVKRFGETIKNRLGEDVIRMSVFGSKVRGDDKKTSDIDMLLASKT